MLLSKTPSILHSSSHHRGHRGHHFQGHSQLWDALQPSDSRGYKILDWILNSHLHILNDGSATQTSRITGNVSTPYISLCGSNLLVKTFYKLTESIGSSDHFPVVIEINHKIRYQLVIPRSLNGEVTTLIGPASPKKLNRKWKISQGTKLISTHLSLQQHPDICSNHSRWEIKTEQEIQTLDDSTRAS